MTSQSPIWQTAFGDGPTVACAIHDGHDVRPDVADFLRLDAAQNVLSAETDAPDLAELGATLRARVGRPGGFGSRQHSAVTGEGGAEEVSPCHQGDGEEWRRRFGRRVVAMPDDRVL